MIERTGPVSYRVQVRDQVWHHTDQLLASDISPTENTESQTDQSGVLNRPNTEPEGTLPVTLPVFHLACKKDERLCPFFLVSLHAPAIVEVLSMVVLPVLSHAYLQKYGKLSQFPPFSVNISPFYCRVYI